MAFYLESGYTSLNKKGEELCGDKVESVVNGDYTTLVLADGMGSGVKANILATLTSKILCTMVAEDIPLDECIETIIQSLPVCKVRGVAYATFSVIHLNRNGEVSGGVRQSSGDFRAGRQVRRPRKRRVERAGKKGLQVGA